MTSKTFISFDKKHQFNIDIIEDTAYFTLLLINPEYYKTFLLLLKNAVELLVNNNVKYIKQYINEEDIVLFKNSIIIKENTFVLVKTKIEDFAYELCDALGIQRL
jgi:hypothetical protein